MYQQYEFAMKKEYADGEFRNETVFCTHQSEAEARQAVTQYYRGWSVADKATKVRPAHQVYGEIDCT